MNSRQTRYAHSADASIAYQVLGTGPIDLVLVNGPASHVELIWEEPSTARSFERLAAFSRLVRFDRRGTGLSDSVSRPCLPPPIPSASLPLCSRGSRRRES